MTLVQWLVCIGIVLVVGAAIFPKWLEQRRVSQAVVDTLTLAEACRKYLRDTGQPPQDFRQLMEDPGVEGWRGPYLDAIPEAPWGGKYVLLPERFKVALASTEKVPAKYRLGGIAEISAVYKEGASWW